MSASSALLNFKLSDSSQNLNAQELLFPPGNTIIFESEDNSKGLGQVLLTAEVKPISASSILDCGNSGANFSLNFKIPTTANAEKIKEVFDVSFEQEEGAGGEIQISASGKKLENLVRKNCFQFPEILSTVIEEYLGHKTSPSYSLPPKYVYQVDTPSYAI